MLLEQNKVFTFHPDTVDVVRKEINMVREDDMRQAVEILKEWVAMQPHFKRKHFPDFYFEKWIVISKGSVERAKSRLDRMCTMRTLLPHYFMKLDVTKDFKGVFDQFLAIICPKLTKEHHRVLIAKSVVKVADAEILTTVYKFCIYVGELMRRFDYVTGVDVIYDMESMDLTKLISKMNLVEFRNILTILLEGYSMRVKSVHVITPSKSIEILLNIAKTFLKPKIIKRIHVIKSRDNLPDIFGKEVLPIELGGQERSVYELHDNMVELIATKEYTEWHHAMCDARTDEELRPSGKFNEEYAGTPGTFRILNLD